MRSLLGYDCIVMFSGLFIPFFILNGSDCNTWLESAMRFIFQCACVRLCVCASLLLSSVVVVVVFVLSYFDEEIVFHFALFYHSHFDESRRRFWMIPMRSYVHAFDGMQSNERNRNIFSFNYSHCKRHSVLCTCSNQKWTQIRLSPNNKYTNLWVCYAKEYRMRQPNDSSAMPLPCMSVTCVRIKCNTYFLFG